jgi:signal peptidase I
VGAVVHRQGKGKAGSAPSNPPPRPWLAPLTRVGAILGTAAAVALVLVFIGALFLAVLTRQSPKGVPAAFGQRAFIVLSGSTSPTFNTVDLILDRSVSLHQAGHLHRGQVISFEVSPRSSAPFVISHRIYRVSRQLNAKTQRYTTVYETKGDANPAPDHNRILPGQVVGTYEARVPDAGYVLQALHQPVVFVPVISVPFALLIILEARRRWKMV